MLGLTIGVTSAIGLWLLDVPFFYVLALIAAIGEMIPVVGPILAAIPAVAVAAHRLAATRCCWSSSSSSFSSSSRTTCWSRRSWSGRSASAPSRHRRAAHRRHAARHPRRDPRGADRRHPPGARQRGALARRHSETRLRHANRAAQPASDSMRAVSCFLSLYCQMRIDPLAYLGDELDR